MHKAAYTQLLTPVERAAGIRAGGALMIKQSGLNIADVPGGAAKAIAVTALLTGIPIGIAAHLVGRHITSTQNKEKELQERIGYFRDATSNMERGLASRAPIVT